MQLPVFPEGVTYITDQLAFMFMKNEGQVTYFNGHMPVFSHAENDIATFRMITSQFCVSGHVKQSDIIRKRRTRQPFFTSMVMCASTTARPKHCPNTMWRVSACV